MIAFKQFIPVLAGLSRGDEIAILNGEVGEFNGRAQVRVGPNTRVVSVRTSEDAKLLVAPREGFEPRVQWTVDFESTAIPGYAISAKSSHQRIRDKDDWIPRTHAGGGAERRGRNDSRIRCSHLSGWSPDKLGIAHSTVLAVVGDTIIPHTSMISDDVSIELVVVSSGG